MTKNSGSGSTPRPSKRVRLPQMKYPDASQGLIYSNPTVIMFGKPTKRPIARFLRSLSLASRALPHQSLALEVSAYDLLVKRLTGHRDGGP